MECINGWCLDIKASTEDAATPAMIAVGTKALDDVFKAALGEANANSNFTTVMCGPLNAALQ